jgi:arylsulfatase A-like enzyme
VSDAAQPDVSTSDATRPDAPAPKAKPKARPNIVFIIADDMTRDMFNCLPRGRGKNLTPNIDRLAAEGVLMLGQHVVSPVCTPSRYSCLTGRFPSRARNAGFLANTRREGATVVTWNTHIVSDDVTLPKLLKAAGYVTGMVGKNHVIDVPGLEKLRFKDDPRDPDVKAKLERNVRAEQAAVRVCGFDFADRLYKGNPQGGMQALAVHNLDWIVEGALEFIERHAGEGAEDARPFFLYFASTIPHGPWEAKRSWNADRRITPYGVLDSPPKGMPSKDTLVPRLRAAGIEGRNKENVLWLDDAVGALMRKLEERGALEDTIVFFFTDHGQEAKGTLYQAGVCSPSIVWRKRGFACGKTSEALVSNVDFAPTILDMAGAGYEPDVFDGRSFLPVLEGEPGRANESLYFELGYTRAVRKGRWKYLALRHPARVADMGLEERSRILKAYNARRKAQGRNVVTTDPTKPFSHITLVPGGGGAEAKSTGAYRAYFAPDQLYDLDADPRERRNLAREPEHAAKLEEMKRELRSYLDRLPGKFGEMGTSP